MSTFFGCIADDFTGATDIAGLLARSGCDVNLRIGVPDEPPAETAAFEVIALKIRTVPVKDAIDQSRKALDWLRQAGAQRFYWKYCSTFDSTPIGNIGPVAEALMEALGTQQTIYCPAFPENGRTVFMGNLFVGDMPLAESPMKDHPLTPMRDSNLMRLLEPQVSRPVGLINRLIVAQSPDQSLDQGPNAIHQACQNAQDEGVAHLVVDAVEDRDLERIASACQTMPLLTGGSALAMPLAQLYRDAGLLGTDAISKSRPETSPGAIVLSGSCSAMTRKQVAEYKKQAPSYQLDPLILYKDGVSPALDWLANCPLDVAPLLYASAEPEDVAKAQAALGVEKAGAIVENALAELAIAARADGRRRFVVAGGETSGAVTKALGVSKLAIGTEITPGVPWTYSESAGEAIALALKSGNFGDIDFFRKALEVIDK